MSAQTVNAQIDPVTITPADALRDAGARLRAATDAEAAAAGLLSGYLDTGRAEQDATAKATAEQAVAAAEEALHDALAGQIAGDTDPKAVEKARTLRDAAAKRRDAIRADGEPSRGARGGLKRRLDRAKAETADAMKAVAAAEVAFLKEQMDMEDRRYAETVRQIRASYSRFFALKSRLRGHLGNQIPGYADKEVRLPVLGDHSKALRPHPEQTSPAFSSSSSAHDVAATEALRIELQELHGHE